MFSPSKLLKLTWEVNLGSIISTFLTLSPFSGGKYPNLMICSLLYRETLSHDFSKKRKANRLKFCIRHAFMVLMTQAKFHFNRMRVTLVFGIWASEAPSPGPLQHFKNALNLNKITHSSIKSRDQSTFSDI